jgi:hypothetical protein
MANRKSDERKKKIDVSHRSRDELGRFAKMEDLKSPSSRAIRLVKVKGSYKTYEVKERWFTDEERDIIYAIITLTLLILI